MKILDKLFKEEKTLFPDKIKGFDNYTVEETTFESFDNTQISYKIVQPKKFNKKKVEHIILFLHGWNDHSSVYLPTASFFIDQNYLCYIPDLRGHGLSAGEKGHVQSWSDYIEDTKILLEKIHRKYPESKVTLFGHSMGGLIAIRFIQSVAPSPSVDKIVNMILSAPLLELVSGISRTKKLVGRFMSGVVPKFALIEKFDPAILTHDMQMIEAIKGDELRHYKVSAKWYTEMQKASDSAFEEATFVTIPTLIVQGGNDKLNSLDANRRYYDLIRSEKKIFKIFPEMFHEVLNESNNFRVYNYILKWLEELKN